MARLSSELSVDDVLGSRGVIAEYIPGFQTRKAQLDMAELIHQCIEKQESHVIEASTGIGKSFAYLVPAFLHEGKTLISTGTKNLQDQLFHKDIPLISKTILSGKKLALLKGRSNYACLHRISKHRQQRRFQTRQMAQLFDALADWATTSVTGDIAEFSDIPEQDSLWFFATSNADNCLGAECPEFDDCYVFKARRKAQDADVVVINHHLFFSDQTLKLQGFGELLPEFDILVFDEAHQLPDIASNFYGRSMTLRQYDMLMRDIIDAKVSEARDNSQLQEAAQANQKAIADFRLVLGQFNQRGEWKHIQHAPKLIQAIADLNDQMQTLKLVLESAKSRGRELTACFSRFEAFEQFLADFQQVSSDQVAWYEWNERNFRLVISPVDISREFSQHLPLNHDQSFFFVSATLSANLSFDYFTSRLGLEDMACERFDSPFDFEQQAMLYLPDDLPDPSDDRFADRFAERSCELIAACEGNCFMLFTSYRMLSLVASILRRRLKNKLFVQGEQQRSDLLKDYLKTPHAILLGTSSFWEGVDVKGDRLKMVIIDKLPFKSPGDPVYKRRLQLAAERGGNAFTDIQVPEATIALRQGVGRLIRDIHDRGLVMLADNRLTKKGYGKDILNSLPPMTQTQALDSAVAFARSLVNDS